jgi:hypothetical protein
MYELARKQEYKLNYELQSVLGSNETERLIYCCGTFE